MFGWTYYDKLCSGILVQKTLALAMWAQQRSFSRASRSNYDHDFPGNWFVDECGCSRCSRLFPSFGIENGGELHLARDE